MYIHVHVLILFFFSQFQDFLFSHFTLISCHLEQLREKIEEALWNRRQLLPELVTNAYHTFVDDFRAVYCAQRIKVWTACTSYNYMYLQFYMYMYLHVFTCTEALFLHDVHVCTRAGTKVEKQPSKLRRQK